MNRKELIRKLINFDEEGPDTSTGFVSASGPTEMRTPFGEYGEEDPTGALFDYFWTKLNKFKERMMPDGVYSEYLFDVYEDTTDPYIIFRIRITEADYDSDWWLGGEDEEPDTIEEICRDIVDTCNDDLADSMGLYDDVPETELKEMYNRKDYTELWIKRPLNIVKYLAQSLLDYMHNIRPDWDVDWVELQRARIV